MGYSWYRVDSSMLRHPKMIALKAELCQPLADAYVNRLWAWTQVYAPGGRFGANLVRGLESELLWTGSEGSLAAALEKTGWLERIGDEYEVHDWADFQGYWVKKSKKDADKKRKRRSRMSARTAPYVRADGAAPSPRTAPPTDETDETDGRREKPLSREGLEPKPRKQSAQQEFFAWSQASAKESNPAFLASASPKPALLNAQLKTYIETIGRQGLESAWGEYKKDQYAIAQGLPWGLFVSKISELHNRLKTRPQQTKARVVTSGEDIYATPGDQQ